MSVLREIVRGCIICMVAQLAFTQQQEQRVSAADADEHLVKKVEPVSPTLAKAARLQGKVTIQVVVSKEGACEM